MSTSKKRNPQAKEKGRKSSSEAVAAVKKSGKGTKDTAAKAPVKSSKRNRTPEKLMASTKVAKIGRDGREVSKKIDVTEPSTESDDEIDAGEDEMDDKDDASEGESSTSKTTGADVDETKRMAEASEESEDDEEEDGEMLHGLSDLSDVDSSDEDEAGSIGEISKSGVVRLPSSRDDIAVKTKLDNVHKKRKESGKSTTPMVLYFGRVPKSMPEEPLRAYLTQFGDISRLRLSRNKRTGASKHYAFVEFKDEDVGKIVQETMNNYLLEGRLLQVRTIPKDKVHPSMWIGADRKWRKVPESRRFRVKHDDTKTSEEKERVQRKLLKRQEQRRQKIKSQGIDYDFVGYVAT